MGRLNDKELDDIENEIYQSNDFTSIISKSDRNQNQNLVTLKSTSVSKVPKQKRKKYGDFLKNATTRAFEQTDWTAEDVQIAFLMRNFTRGGLNTCL